MRRASAAYGLGNTLRGLISAVPGRGYTVQPEGDISEVLVALLGDGPGAGGLLRRGTISGVQTRALPVAKQAR